MLPENYVRDSLEGAWRLLFGKADGVQRLDVTEDGFWNSFVAIPVAMPALFISWLGLVNELGDAPLLYGSHISIFLRIVVIDLATWLLPLVALALVVRLADIADRFTHYVVASNWASVILVWMMLPAAFLRLAPSLVGLADFVAFAVFAASLVLTWRLTNAILNKGPATATTVFAGVLVTSFIVLFTLQSWLGLSVTP